MKKISFFHRVDDEAVAVDTVRINAGLQVKGVQGGCYSIGH